MSKSWFLLLGAWLVLVAGTAAEPTSFAEEYSFLKSLVGHHDPLSKPEDYLWPGELTDDFSGPLSAAWSVWVDELSREDAVVRIGQGRMMVDLPVGAGQRAAGLRTRERLVSVPSVDGAAFYLEVDLNSEESAAGAVVITPLAYPALYGRPQIRVVYSRGEKLGAVSLVVDGEFIGRYQIPRATTHPIGLVVTNEEVMLVDAHGSMVVRAALPYWAAPGTSLYASLVAVSGGEAGKGRFLVNSVRFRHPLMIRRDSCLVWENPGEIVLDDPFSVVNEKSWAVIAKDSLAASRVVTGTRGLEFSVPSGHGWGRGGVVSRDPVVPRPSRSGRFTSIEIDLDTRYTVGARFFLARQVVDDPWTTPHVRLALEQRGLVHEAWLADYELVVSQFQVPREVSCRLTLLVGTWGIYVLGPDCSLRGGVPIPSCLFDESQLSLQIMSWSPRPNRATSLGLRRVIIRHDGVPLSSDLTGDD